jgi:hypothetical protein
VPITFAVAPSQPVTIRRRGGKFAVKLSNVGNPDFRQDCTRPLPGVPVAWAHVGTIREASELCRAYIAYYDLGGGNWNGGEIVRNADGLVLGRVSYNGRVWATDNKELAI